MIRIQTRMDTLWAVMTRTGQRTGLDTAAVIALMRAGDITPASLVWREGFPNWVPLRQVPELAGALAPAPGVQGGHQPWETPPPPPGQPWFHNVSPGRALLLDIASGGFYSLVWAYRHRTWLEGRTGHPLSSAFWTFRYDKWLPAEVAAAAQRAGVRDRVNVTLAPISDVLLVFSAFCFCLLPVVLCIGVLRLRELQTAAEVVNQAVAPGAPRPPMDVGEWISAVVGLGIWGCMLLLFGLNLLVALVGE
jgi:hypothetical protein